MQKLEFDNEVCALDFILCCNYKWDALSVSLFTFVLLLLSIISKNNFKHAVQTTVFLIQWYALALQDFLFKSGVCSEVD